ncbi:flagellar hook-associated protein FlgL [Jeotgalibacillus proteolyticus]|uniref:Flagellar hook-associated protein FlgL n=1 Tax=Jeotgalibacillus proteolyticus TaxID=2082395 RepID=A0A2S5GBF6_9BACL|nr:flagellar hook-associated protein FlgL [Jeotgalibacillus proteolyticus]PPA70244.1 flagellar hook-associated protein FlgL [Jeotgalibacillus proteolyticus]
MRVTQSMIASSMLRNLSQSFDRMGTLQEQVASQKKINRPSDDPVIAMKGVTYRRNLLEIEQFKRNYGEAYNWTENSDAALDKTGGAMQRIRELTVQAGNDTYDAEQRKSISEEIRQLKEHIAELGNTKFGDKYLFNGTNTLEKPINLSHEPAKTSTNAEPVQIELSKGIFVSVNVNGGQIFSPELFEDLDALIGALEDPESTGEDIGGYLNQLDGHMNNITNTRANLGARHNRIELMEVRTGEMEVISTKIMSQNEDIDFERTVTDLTVQESIHRAALSIGSRIIQPSLIDFLR